MLAAPVMIPVGGALKTRKARLFSSVMDDGNVFGTTLDANDIRALLS